MARLYPYQTLFGDLDLTVLSVRIDGAKPDAQVIDLNEDAVDLFLSDRKDWNKVTLELDAAGPPSGIGKFDDADANLVLTAIAHCGPTNVRVALPLERSASDPARWSGTLELPRSSFYGQADLKAVLAGTVGGMEWRFLKASNSWDVRFDEPAIPPIDGTLNVQWVHFTGDDKVSHPLLRRYAHEAFYVDLESSTPVVYLNLDFEHLQELLEDRTRRGPEAALHDAVRSATAAKVWVAMFGASLGSVVDQLPPTKDGEPDPLPTFPSTSWQDEVLHRVLAVMYDDKSADDALAEVVRLWKSEDGANAVQSHVTAAVEKHIDAGKLLRRAARRIYEEA